MSTLFSIELIDSYLKNNLDVNYIVSLMKKYNISIKDLNHFKADDILYIIYEAVPYIWGLLMTTHSFNDGISPDVIKDVSDHLYDYSFEEIMDKLNMSDYLLDGNKEKTTSIGR